MALNFSKQVQEALGDYQNDVVKIVQKEVPAVGREAAKKLRSDSPRKTGRYAKGWASESEITRLGASSRVYGKSGTYQLAHLLEHGHAKRGGGRVAPIVHIQPVEDWAAEEVESRIVRGLS